jgi:uncharacterized Zn-finger protein
MESHLIDQFIRYANKSHFHFDALFDWINQHSSSQVQDYHHYLSPPLSTTSNKEAITAQLSPPRETARRTTPSLYQCPECSHFFKRAYNLKSHQKTHTNERPFPCLFPGCAKKFTRRQDLPRHERTHTGDKPYECSCKKRFARKDTLLKHKPKCKNCGSQMMNENFTVNVYKL